MQHQTATFPGRYGFSIFTQQWLPDTAPRAIVLLAHGIAEHSGRYTHVAEAFTARGYALSALDHRGHGKSDGPRMHAEQFDDYVTDLHTCFERIRAAYPNTPIFSYGHSMGSLISLLFALRCQDQLAGLITTGTALIPAGATPQTARILKTISRVSGKLRLVPSVAQNISRDPAVVERYLNDPLVTTGKLPIGAVLRLIQAAEQVKEQLPTLRLPYLALHGGADLITLPDAISLIRERAGSSDLTTKIYEGA
ncbi:MAG TPA: alpha/beta hydrolase, partial [Aggregatilineaceae bacterium]|nr:alpha/beta hydrolase [Aggregatilineaceae bacterium]